MWAEISEFVQQGPIRSEIIQSVLLIIGVLLVRAVILQTHFRRHPTMQIEDMRRWVVVSRNLTLIACLIGLISVWAAQI
ncbi:MAG: mechanosensitive ion channel family protein, partial [Neisseria sp.]|nr:mechanosensitive ion channel family protein [Neisseria sp.]